MAVTLEVLREVWRITERRDGAVFRTEFVEERWMTLVEASLTGTRPDSDPDLIWVPSTKAKTFRTKIAVI